VVKALLGLPARRGRLPHRFRETRRGRPV